MATRTTDALFQLIQSLTKAEKKNFKLFMTRNISRSEVRSSADALKVVRVFEAFDKMEQYDDEILLKKNPDIKRQQVSNLKAHLYKQILLSLRLLKDADNIDIQLHEQMDFARILYNKGLYLQSLRVLDKLKDTAREYHQITYLQQAIFFEKKIEALYITRSMQDRAERLADESIDVQVRIGVIGQLSNLSLLLYSWYIKHGHARNPDDIAEVDAFFGEHIPPEALYEQGFYERLYVYQAYCWLHFIKQNYVQYFRYTKKWIALFDEYPAMKEVETGWYIKGLHNLLGAYFDVQRIQEMKHIIEEFRAFAETDIVRTNENYRVLSFVYIHLATINVHFSEGTFTQGTALIPPIESQLEEYRRYLDEHRILVFYYKFASMYFGSGDNVRAIEYLNRIIHSNTDLRTDLQCYARLLHLIAHYELGNMDVVEHQIKSVYRFMASMKNIGPVERALFEFLRASFHVDSRHLRSAFQELAEKLSALYENPFAQRSRSYLDVVSWLESKTKHIPVEQIIQEKYARRATNRIA
jgi:hypothetical protein